MVGSVALRNFRCFESLELHALKRINILVGRNSAGKTALLESIFLAAGGSPELALRLRLWRGMGPGAQISIDRRSYESLWRDLFYSLDQRRVISIDLIGSPENTRSLTVAYRDQASLTLPLGKQELPTEVIVPVVFEWRDSAGRASSVEVKISEQGLNLMAFGETVHCAFFATSFAAGNPAENAARFSELSTQNRERELIRVLKREFPHIEELSLQINAGVTMLYASVSPLKEKIPLGVVSNGINKLAALLLAVASYPRGLVLVDEIENGFYHATLPAVWSSLLHFCSQNDTQLFATTHSLECLKAALPVVSKNPEEFCLVRMERENGRFTAVAFDGHQFESAIEQAVDVR